MANYLEELGMTPTFRILLIVGAFAFLLLILFMLKKGKLNVQYAIIWIAAGFVLVLFALWPALLLHLRNITDIEVVANLVFLILFAFVLLVILSLSTIVSGFAKRIKRLVQTQALLEKRVRELENALAKVQSSNPKED